MANRYRNLIYSTAEYTHSYGGFRGVDLNAGALVSSKSRLAYSKNMYKDYDGDGADVIESVPGFRCFANYEKTVHAIYYQRSVSGGEDHIIVHVKDALMRHPVSDINSKNAVGVCIAKIKDTKSFGFEYGKYYYVMDTEAIYRIDGEGACLKIGTSGAYPYVPTTHVSGEVHEQRNLLTDDFKEEYYVSDPRAYLFSTKRLKYNVTDPYLRYCAVSGADDTVSGAVYLPSYVNIGGMSYKVTSVDSYAFANNTSISAVYVADGITDIGSHAFSDCKSLHTVVMSPTVSSIKEYAFYGCSSLTSVYIGAAISHIGINSFTGTPTNASISYALGETELSLVDGYDQIKNKSLTYQSKYGVTKLSLPLSDKVNSVISVTVNGKDHEFETETDDSLIKSVLITFSDITEATGAEISISGTLAPLENNWAEDMSIGETVTPYRAIAACRCAEVYDGRVFFSGNPDFPNTVFYTERSSADTDGSLYVGRYNYFNDGVGSYRVISLMSVRDMLAVFKEGDDGSGSIFYHKKESVSSGAIGAIYPIAYVHSGICCKGSSLSFLDDPVFLAPTGLLALNSENINYQRNVVCRSHNVNYALLKEDLSKAYLCEWLGYLAVGINGKIFLADSRAVFTHPSGSREYEWFMLEDIGTYTKDSAVYRFSSDTYADTTLHPTLIGEAADTKDVYSASDENGKLYYYALIDGVKYSLISTEERCGGIFSPAAVFASHGTKLFFATEDGHLCLFNNDMRGVAPDSVKESDDYDEQIYSEIMGNRIHPFYYSFDGHAPTYEVKTALDDCGVPHLTKSSVKKSLVIKAKSYLSDAISCYVATDGNDPVYIDSFPASSFSFDDFDFSTAPWYTGRYLSVALPEKEKRWIEKQLILTSRTFASPISIYSISYRYRIKGKIKNNS